MYPAGSGARVATGTPSLTNWSVASPAATMSVSVKTSAKLSPLWYGYDCANGACRTVGQLVWLEAWL